MTEEQTQSVDELDLNTSSDSEGESPDGQASSESGLPEHTTERSEDELDIDNNINTQTKKAQEEREKQIKTYLDRVNSGKMGVNEIPHKWIKDEVAKRTTPNVDIDKLIEEKLEARESTKRFETLKSELKSQKLTSEQAEVVKSTYAELAQNGLKKDKALEMAMKIAGVQNKPDDTDELKKAMRIPTPSYDGQTRSVKDVDKVLKLSEAERLKHYEAIRKAK
jgi:hypothetical protein